MKVWLYNFAVKFCWLILKLLYGFKYAGRENVPEGPALICANHSSAMDPVMVAVACGTGHKLFFMAKKSLFSIPLLGSFMRAIGTFPVDRGNADIGAIKNSLRLLKTGEKVMLFPEGTRSDEELQAKNGAIMLASRAGVPIVPVFVPRDKKIFRGSKVVIGKPMYFEKVQGVSANESYARSARLLMDEIRRLGEIK